MSDKQLFTTVAPLLLILIVWSLDAFATDESSLSSSLLSFQDQETSHTTISPGQVVELSGFVASNIDVNMTVALFLVSNGTEGVDWVLVDASPREPFKLSASESVQYQFMVHFLEDGTFLIQPNARILQIPNRTTPIEPGSPDCSCKARSSVVSVKDTVEVPNQTLTYVAIVSGIVAAGGIGSAWYLVRRRSISKPKPE